MITRTREELIEGLSFSAYRRVSTMIVPIQSHRASSVEMVTIEPSDLQAAQDRDAATYQLLLANVAAQSDGNRTIAHSRCFQHDIRASAAFYRASRGRRMVATIGLGTGPELSSGFSENRQGRGACVQAWSCLDRQCGFPPSTCYLKKSFSLLLRFSASGPTDTFPGVLITLGGCLHRTLPSPCRREHTKGLSATDAWFRTAAGDEAQSTVN
jgi:hypothetical protein